MRSLIVHFVPSCGSKMSPPPQSFRATNESKVLINSIKNMQKPQANKATNRETDKQGEGEGEMWEHKT